jgi:hypothetical protein
MTPPRRSLLGQAEAIVELERALAKCPKVRRYDLPDHNEASTLAHAFSDLEKSFSHVLDEQLPRLTRRPLSNHEINDVLLDIGEELRHILYHVKDARFYSYLVDENTVDKEEK